MKIKHVLYGNSKLPNDVTSKVEGHIIRLYLCKKRSELDQYELMRTIIITLERVAWQQKCSITKIALVGVSEKLMDELNYW